MKQRTLKKAITLEGVGLHTGKMVKMTIHPAAVNHGYKFQRSDLEKQPTFKADVNFVDSTKRGTSLKSGEAYVHTGEHTLSALVGLEIDNALIELNASEAPILDGSAKLIVEAIQAVGIEEQDEEKEYFIITEPISYKDEETGTELLALPYDGFEIKTLIDFNSPILGKQYAEMSDFGQYVNNIAPCRTFVFLRELEKLAEMDLIKGGDLDNAVVIADQKMEQANLDDLMLKLGKPSVKIDKEGILNTTDLRFKNEPARHKLLDVIGDLALVGKPIKGRIIATKPGHKANVAFAKILKQAYMKQRKLKGKPNYDPNKTPLMNSVQIAEWLPHRYPMLLVDKITELSENHVVGVKNITFNEAIFQGHFPGNPVFPGVLQIEAMAQTGGILALSLQEDPGNWNTYFLKIDNAKFKQMVLPGDTILFKLELLAPIRRGIVQMKGTAYVGDKIVSEAELTAQIVKRN